MSPGANRNAQALRPRLARLFKVKQYNGRVGCALGRYRLGVERWEHFSRASDETHGVVFLPSLLMISSQAL